MSILSPPSKRPRYAWARRGDVNAFFGLMLDNVGDMILMAGPAGRRQSGSPAEFVLTRMIPGTAVGVMVGRPDLHGDGVPAWRGSPARSDVTAMPLGLDTPSTFGSVVPRARPGVQGGHQPKGLEPGGGGAGGLVRRDRDDPGLGDLQARLRVFGGLGPADGPEGRVARVADGDRAGPDQLPAAARHRLDADRRDGRAGGDPGHAHGPVEAAVGLPGGAGRRCSVGLVSTMGCTWRAGAGAGRRRDGAALDVALPGGPCRCRSPSGSSGSRASWRETLEYLPVAIPLALGTVVGGIDCTESAASVGDEYPTGGDHRRRGRRHDGRRGSCSAG